MITEVMTITGWAFWVFVAAVVLIEIFILASGMEEVPVPIFIAVAALSFVVLFSDAFEGARPAWLIISLIAYGMAGVAWSFKKWMTFLIDARNASRERYEAYANKNAPGNETWEEASENERPTATKNKSRIVTWMALWPFSFSWWVLTWPRHFFTWAYEQLSTVYDRISERIWSAQ